MKSQNDFETIEDYKKYLRVYFAGLAMQGLLANTNIIHEGSFDYHRKKDEISNISCLLAESILKELEK